jgi:hypothetical protein
MFVTILFEMLKTIPMSRNRWPHATCSQKGGLFNHKENNTAINATMYMNFIIRLTEKKKTPNIPYHSEGLLGKETVSDSVAPATAATH